MSVPTLGGREFELQPPRTREQANINECLKIDSRGSPYVDVAEFVDVILVEIPKKGVSNPEVPLGIIFDQDGRIETAITAAPRAATAPFPSHGFCPVLPQRVNRHKSSPPPSQASA